MHELSIVFAIADSVEKTARENRVRRVTKVSLQIGAVSMIVNSYLEDCWKWTASKRELLKGAELEIETIPAVSYCQSCQKTYDTFQGKICPYCQSPETYLLQGNEISIKDITVEDEDCEDMPE
ncbi:MAG: hydrogenase maturation nickel metallochaperone HypA [Erysipelotrichaceae bacterium]|nr:hydrogenase maturation nickel metallochaperone HypA [Erysipelotrichaceae bacterium]